MTTSSPARPAFRGLRLWPEEYEDLREEARVAVKAGMEMMAGSGAVPARPEPATDPVARITGATSSCSSGLIFRTGSASLPASSPGAGRSAPPTGSIAC
jgi:hypothetical protein